MLGDVAILAAIVLVLLTGNLAGAALVLVWRSITRTPWSELGFVRPRSLAIDIVAGIVGGLLLKLLTKAVVLPLLGADPINHTYQFLVGDPRALTLTLLFVIVGGGFGEELIWRGFLFERSRKIFGASPAIRAATVVFTSLLFASAHLYDQGWAGAAQAVVTGLAFGIAFARLGRIWPMMVAHAAYDVAAILIIYWQMELPIAHLVFHSSIPK